MKLKDILAKFGKAKPTIADNGDDKPFVKATEKITDDSNTKVLEMRLDCNSEDMAKAKAIGNKVIALFEREGINPDRITMIALSMLLHSNAEESATETSTGSKDMMSGTDTMEAFTSKAGGIIEHKTTGEKFLMSRAGKTVH